MLNKRLKKRIKPNELIQKITNNLNTTKTPKYGFATSIKETKNIARMQFREQYNFHTLILVS